MSHEEQEGFQDLTNNKEILNSDDAAQAIESAGSTLSNMLKKASGNLQNILDSKSEEPADPEEVLKVIEEVKSKLKGALDSLQTEYQSSNDGDMPSESELEETLQNADPNLLRSYEEMKDKASKELNDLKSKISKVLEIPVDELEEEAVQPKSSANFEKGTGRRFK